MNVVISSRSMEKVCWCIALLCFCFLLECAFQGRAASAAGEHPSPAMTGPAPSGAILGRIEIPALNLTVPVVEDDDTRSLLRGLGHIRGTAMLGGLGTTALAGHRDTFLRPLRRVTLKMEIRAIDATGTYRYIVDSTEIVNPEQVHVLDIQDRPELVLITCYPFEYIGAAPQRFIVHAHLVSADPDPVLPKGGG